MSDVSGDIITVDHAQIVPWTHRAARERVSLKDARATTWYSVTGRGCAALMVLKGKARIKGVFVLKEYRGAGVGTALVDRLETEAAALDGIKEIEVYAHNPGFYEARGYSVVGKNQFGVALLRRALGAPSACPSPPTI